MLDHFNLPVSNLDSSVVFYRKVLKPLGMTLLVREEDAAGFGADTWSFGLERTSDCFPAIHLAFKAESREVVQCFYQTALAANGRDNGQPGLRENYGANYYAAYILDPDGHNIEAVCRGNVLLA